MKKNTVSKQSDHIQTLRLILGDQLNLQHSWFQQTDQSVLYVIAELPQETGYVKHHIQKLCAFFAAMREFANTLKRDGHQVLHLTLDETAALPSLPELLNQLIEEYEVQTLEHQRPDEFRLLQQLRNMQAPDGVLVAEVDTEHFLLPFDEIESYFKAGKHTRMESFYRKMRKRFDILMEAGEPEGGRWNFDADNRNKLSTEALEQIPAPLLFENDVSNELRRLETHEVQSFGTRRDSLELPVNRKQALQLLEHFCRHCLTNFGRYQDAMTCQSEHDWSLYHSRLSFALNSKLLSPFEVISSVVAAYRANKDVDLAQAEGFVRQILGWREFVRGVYWINMPDYEGLNALEARTTLPEFFWTGETDMNCMHHAIRNSLDHAHAHHIQRLMVTGNFSLLGGLDLDQVDAWYLGIYADALQWVELPNTRGMALYGDGGIVGTKPYAASSNYINKLSDYCKSCKYQAGKKHGEGSCPFNSLYWHFMHRHREKFSSNHRMGMLYRTWDRMEPGVQDAVLTTASNYLENIESL